MAGVDQVPSKELAKRLRALDFGGRMPPAVIEEAAEFLESLAPEPCADQLAAKDAMSYGSGFVRVMPDGSREHVPHHDVFIEPSDERAAQPPKEGRA